ncbi:hypothetical protein [Actinomadura sp. DC4]|uniref:hypothetical protein n=1 Tax=Actinomadura sp. DC4 TaxID=3055069 RepID=UPI0025B14914|nr:hypothetical protein [Actinomadura sp. DC4]MDN3353008.1 hypothetical protein [Actinomadura sp. DC4]
MPSTRDLALRRRRLREAVHGRSPREEPGPGPLTGIGGTIVDASPHLLVLSSADGSEVRVPIASDAFIWHAGRADVTAFQPGRDVILRPAGRGGLVAERIWVDIARVTGVIAGRSGRVIEVDSGRHRGRTALVVPPESMSRIRVRHPRLEAGSLIDVIGVRRGGEVHGLSPATHSPQPAAHADRPSPSRRSGSVPLVLRGTATWYDPPQDAYGAAYPALDRHGDAGGCGTGPASPLPFLSIACELDVRNECAGRATRVPIVECGCLAARFCDRCVRCGTSPRGRILELTRSAFVDLGGDLDKGCFNVTARVDGAS